MELMVRNRFLPALASDSLSQYMDAVHQIPKLDRADEEALFARFFDHDDLDAARTLVMAICVMSFTKPSIFRLRDSLKI